MSGLLLVRVKDTPVLLRKSSLTVCSGGWFGMGRVALWICTVFSWIVQESGCQQKQEQGAATCCRHFPAPGIACVPPLAVFHQDIMPSCLLSLAASQGDGVHGSKWSGCVELPPAFIAPMLPCQCPMGQIGAGRSRESSQALPYAGAAMELWNRSL